MRNESKLLGVGTRGKYGEIWLPTTGKIRGDMVAIELLYVAYMRNMVKFLEK